MELFPESEISSFYFFYVNSVLCFESVDPWAGEKLTTRSVKITFFWFHPCGGFCILELLSYFHQQISDHCLLCSVYTWPFVQLRPKSTFIVLNRRQSSRPKDQTCGAMRDAFFSVHSLIRFFRRQFSLKLLYYRLI